MRKRIIRSRRARYGGMTVLLTVLLIAVVVLTNVLFSTLAKRYSWYTPDEGKCGLPGYRNLLPSA